MSISEKDKKIVAAVYFIGVKDSAGDMQNYIYQLRSGEFYFGSARTSATVCTIEEYNQCLEDMSRAEWMDADGLPVDITAYHNYELYKSNCEIEGIDTSNKELLKEPCDYSFYDKPSSAEKTLTNLGYRDCGGELWKPPLGKAPDFINEPLVYTQEMLDNGEVPGVGMWCLWKCGQHEDREIKIISIFGDYHWALINGEDIPTVVGNISDLLPTKTPEQIKQDKLKAQESEVLDLIIGEGFIVHKGLVAFLQSSGYIVEPK